MKLDVERKEINRINGVSVIVYRQDWMEDDAIWQSTIKQLLDWFGQKGDKVIAVASQPSVNSVDCFGNSYFAQLQNELNDLFNIARTDPYKKLNASNDQVIVGYGGGGGSSSSSTYNVSVGGMVGGGVSYSYTMDDFGKAGRYGPTYEKAGIILDSLHADPKNGLFGYKCTIDPDGCYYKISKDNNIAVQIKIVGGMKPKRKEFIDAIIEIENSFRQKPRQPPPERYEDDGF